MSVVYTAVLGGYDRLRQQPATGDRFVAFVDGASGQDAGAWECITTECELRDARLTARWHKIMTHRVLEDCEYSLWIDGSIAIAQERSVASLAEEFLKDADIATFRHYTRDCIYDEAWHCIHQGLDNKAVIYAQVENYTAAGYPQNAGLVETCVILRRHSKTVERLNESWWQEVTRHSVRDQISFNFVARKLGIPYATFPGSILANPFFVRHRHLGERGGRPSG